jgi:glutathione S-transferase
MELYFSPLACSMASRIAFYEAGAEPRFNQVDPKLKRAADDVDFYTVNPMGQVPTLRLGDGSVLTENAVVLQYIADQFPASGLAPAAGGIGRYRVQEWLNFIGTELHKAIFIPLLDPKAAAGAKEFAKTKIARTFGRLNAALDGRETLLDGFTVADAYLVTVLNWGAYSGVDLAEWPAVQAFYQRTIKRPAVARALAEEFRLYKEELARHQAA